MTKLNSDKANLMTPALVALGVFGVSVGAIYTSFQYAPFEMKAVFHEDRVKWIFLCGVVVSLTLQVAVERFISVNRLTEDVDGGWWKSLEIFGAISSFLLFILAIGSIVTIKDFELHATLTIWYLGILLLMDFLYWISSCRALRKKEGGRRMKICKMVTGSVLSKVDLAAFVGTFFLYKYAVWISNNNIINDNIISLKNLNSKSHPANSVTEHDLLWNSFLSHDPEVGEFIPSISHVSHEMPALIFGGAVGVQLAFSSIVLLFLLRDWRRKFNSEIIKGPL